MRYVDASSAYSPPQPPPHPVQSGRFSAGEAARDSREAEQSPVSTGETFDLWTALPQAGRRQTVDEHGDL